MQLFKGSPRPCGSSTPLAVVRAGRRPRVLQVKRSQPLHRLHPGPLGPLGASSSAGASSGPSELLPFPVHSWGTGASRLPGCSVGSASRGCWRPLQETSCCCRHQRCGRAGLAVSGALPGPVSAFAGPSKDPPAAATARPVAGGPPHPSPADSSPTHSNEVVTPCWRGRLEKLERHRSGPHPGAPEDQPACTQFSPALGRFCPLWSPSPVCHRAPRRALL